MGVGKIFQDGEEGAFAVVEGDEVEIVEDAGVAEFAQFGVDVAAAEDGCDLGVCGADGLGDLESAEDVAGERDGDTDDLGLVLVQQVEGEFVDGVSDEGFGGVEEGLEGGEGGLRGGEFFAVAGDLKVGVEALLDGVGDVVEEEGGDVLGAVVESEVAKDGVEGVGVGGMVPGLGERADDGEAGAFGEEFTGGDAPRQRGVLVLEEAKGGRDRREQTREVFKKVLNGGGALVLA